MSDEDVIVDEIGAEPIQTSSQAISDFLKSVEDQNYTQAERQFNDLVGDRLQQTLDQTKARIASAIFNSSETEDEDLDLELDDDYEEEEEV